MVAFLQEEMVDYKDIMRKYRINNDLSQDEMAGKLGVSQQVYSNIESGKKKKIDADFVVKYKEVTGINLWEVQQNNVKETDLPYSRQPKTETDPDREGVIFVPIAAQANYAKSYTNPVYLNQLERVYIPGFPYRGDAYRIFEVAGDSMEPTFKEGYHVVTEYIEPAFWNQIADFYTYVVVTENQVMLKRIYKKSENEFVLISDNEEFHPQIMLPVEKIKELWFVKRKLDWEMSPPKRFEIKI